MRPTAAVIGSGVAGLTAAWALRETHRVTLYERDARLGGHAHTHDVADPTGQQLRIDSGFIVHNQRTYPTLLRLFAELDVPTRATEMSMSISCDGCGLSYAGGRGPGGIVAQPSRLADPRFLRLLREVPRFHRAARAVLASADDPTWAQFLAEHRFGDYFVRHFAVPLVACVWSSGDQAAAAYPARHLFRFLDHHGMLSVTGSPTWRTVVGGSRTYVDRLAGRLDRVRTGAAVQAVTRYDDRVAVRADRERAYDAVVIATHADDALAILADADPVEKADLAAIGYSANHTVLHTDTTVLPGPARARASWNHRLTDCQGEAPLVRVSYWMNRLHGLSPELAQQYLVTLNPTRPLTGVIAEMDYRHPVFTRQAVAAAARLRTAGGPRLAFAGAHLGWGFHEDGAVSGVAAAARLGGAR